MPLIAGAAVVVVLVGGYFGYRAMKGPAATPGESESVSGLEGEGAGVTPAAMSPGFLSVDAQPWAEVVSIRRSETGEEVDLAAGASAPAPTTPVVMDLPPGTYEVTLKHPAFGEMTVQDVQVTQAQWTRLNQSMPGFELDSVMPQAGR